MIDLSKEYQGNIKLGNRKKNPEATKLLKSGNKNLYYKLRVSSRIPNEIGCRNCKYIRYAAGFIVGILGPRSIAVEIRNKVEDFLKNKLNLELSLEKTKVTHVTKGIEFLGYLFSKRQFFIKQSYLGHIITRKIMIPTLDVNMKKVIVRLSEANFCDGNGNPTPAFRYLRLSQSETNLKVNYILKGLSEWWSIANNRKAALARVSYIIRYSIAKVYAAKFKIKTVASVFKISGNDLSKPIGIRSKSVINADESHTPKVSKKELTGVLFDRYYKIPKTESNKLNPKWIPEYLKVLQKKGNTLKTFIKVIWNSKEQKIKNPLASSMAWGLPKTLSKQGVREKPGLF
jgi:Type II intron maturase